MKISDVIEQLRANMPALPGPISWGDRIAGAADLQAVQDGQDLQLPSLFVLLGPDRGTGFSNGHFRQELTEEIIVIACLRNDDRRGQSAQDMVKDVRDGLFVSLLNWVPDIKAHSIEYTGSRFRSMNRAIYFHEFRFQKRSILNEEDGVALNLDDFDKLYNDWDLAESTVGIDAKSHIEGLFTL